MHVKVFAQPMIVLNSLQAARDLLDRRSSIYSDRPRFVLLSELFVVDFSWPILPWLTTNMVIISEWVGAVRQHTLDSTLYFSLGFYMRIYRCSPVDPDSESIAGS